MKFFDLLPHDSKNYWANWTNYVSDIENNLISLIDYINYFSPAYKISYESENESEEQINCCLELNNDVKNAENKKIYLYFPNVLGYRQGFCVKNNGYLFLTRDKEAKEVLFNIFKTLWQEMEINNNEHKIFNLHAVENIEYHESHSYETINYKDKLLFCITDDSQNDVYFSIDSLLDNLLIPIEAGTTIIPMIKDEVDSSLSINKFLWENYFSSKSSPEGYYILNYSAFDKSYYFKFIKNAKENYGTKIDLFFEPYPVRYILDNGKNSYFTGIADFERIKNNTVSLKYLEAYSARNSAGNLEISSQGGKIWNNVFPLYSQTVYTIGTIEGEKVSFLEEDFIMHDHFSIQITPNVDNSANYYYNIKKVDNTSVEFKINSSDSIWRYLY